MLFVQEMQSVQSEILILGGSLAGMACAIELQRLGHSPVVIEKCHFPRKKLCGEFLGPDALRALETLQVLPQVQALATGPVEQTYFYNRLGKRLKIRHAWLDRQFPYGLAIPREILDTVLVQHARMLGVTVWEGACGLSPLKVIEKKLSAEREFQVRVRTSKGQPHESDQQIEKYVCGRYLVDATGRSGKLVLASEMQDRHALKDVRWEKKRKIKTRVGVQCHVRFAENFMNNDLHMFLFSGGYGGLQPIGGCLANICMLVDSSLAKMMHLPFPEFISRSIGQNPVAWEMLQGVQREGVFCTTGDVNLSGESLHQNGHHQLPLLRIGDACVTVDPFTGSGMAHALETGLMAARCIHSAIKNRWADETLLQHYQQQYKHRFQQRLLWMSYFRPLLENSQAQDLLWPVLPPFLPFLAGLFR